MTAVSPKFSDYLTVNTTDTIVDLAITNVGQWPETITVINRGGTSEIAVSLDIGQGSSPGPNPVLTTCPQNGWWLVAAAAGAQKIIPVPAHEDGVGETLKVHLITSTGTVTAGVVAE